MSQRRECKERIWKRFSFFTSLFWKASDLLISHKMEAPGWKLPLIMCSNGFANQGFHAVQDFSTLFPYETLMTGGSPQALGSIYRQSQRARATSDILKWLMAQSKKLKFKMVWMIILLEI